MGMIDRDWYKDHHKNRNKQAPELSQSRFDIPQPKKTNLKILTNYIKTSVLPYLPDLLNCLLIGASISLLFGAIKNFFF